jgi:hypothetical protein
MCRNTWRSARHHPSRFHVQLKNYKILRWKFLLGCLTLDGLSAAKNSTADFVAALFFKICLAEHYKFVIIPQTCRLIPAK